jgi:cytochrome b subunit of formate dehydrogenase
MRLRARRERHRSVLGLSAAALLLLSSVASAPAGRAQTSEQLDCSSCHEQQTKEIAQSAHASVGCLTCHPKHNIFPHPAGIQKPSCASCHASEANSFAQSVHGLARTSGNEAAPDCATCHGDVHTVKNPETWAYRQTVPEICGMCHSDIEQQYLASVHGQAIEEGITQAPVCTDCHGTHTILAPSQAASSVNPRQIPETCGRCHGSVVLSRQFGLPSNRLTSFESSFHGLALKAGRLRVANCASCHGYHDILPSSNPKSMIYPANLPKTCGKCHPGAGTRFKIGSIHLSEAGTEWPPIQWARDFYLVIIPLVIGLMGLHQGGDWIRKLFRLRLKRALPPPAAPMPPEIRMHQSERIQHFLLVLSFAVLVWSGFALKYPDQWWAWVLVRWEDRWPVRGIVHRSAGAVLIALSLAHIVSLISNVRLRDHWKNLWPRSQDAVDGLQALVYNLGLGSKKPAISSHSYVEKVEYWAVVWGTLVMAITGVALWANNFMLAYFPKHWLDLATTIHFYEAVLATLAILVWHFYTVIFDPDVYPMDPAWLTGNSVRKWKPHRPSKSSWQESETGDPRMGRS